MREVIDVHIARGPVSHKIIVDSGLTDRMDEFIADYKQVVVVTDSTVNELFPDKFSGIPRVVVPTGEGSKSFEQLQFILDSFAEIELLRNAAIICFGGGMIGDLAGFAASVYMRGIDFFQVPTTLVSMVDSAIGGKTGINLEAGKNLVGNFCHPKAVLCDPDLIKNLPDREVKNSLAESVKHALIADLSLVETLKLDPKSVEAITRSAKIKVEVIQDDVNEAGQRKWLNVGHSVGHAIEQLSEYEFAHGEAVVIGIYWESFMAQQLGILADLSVVTDVLDTLDLDYSLPDFSVEDIWRVMLNDKKNVNKDKVVFSFVAEPGKSVDVREIDFETFQKLSRELYED